MKHFVLLALIFLPVAASAQALKNSRAYVGGVLQNSRAGGSLILSYGFNENIGIGAGIDVLSYRRSGYDDATSFIPYYLDVRLKIPTQYVEPFVNAQFGRQAYSYKLADLMDGGVTVREQGKVFYGLGAGIGTVPLGGKMGLFASITYRHYQFKYTPKDFDYNGLQLEDRTHGTVILSVGLMFGGH